MWDRLPTLPMDPAEPLAPFLAHNLEDGVRRMGETVLHKIPEYNVPTVLARQHNARCTVFTVAQALPGKNSTHNTSR